MPDLTLALSRMRGQSGGFMVCAGTLDAECFRAGLVRELADSVSTSGQ
jgi:hypothetical protein